MVRVAGWLAEQRLADERRFQHLLAGSFVGHVLFVSVMAIAPMPDGPALPEVLRVDLVAGLPAAGPPAARPAPKPPAPVPVPKEPPPAPKPVPPPKPVPKQVVLPKQAPAAVPVKPVPKKVVAPPRPEPIEYEDALSQLRDELGEDAPPPSETDAETDAAPAAETAPAAEARGSVDKELAAWLVATRRHVRSRYIQPPEFLNRSLATDLEVLLTSSGELVGPPTVLRSSGDPYFDDNAVRALMMSAPLPAPPQAGTYPFRFRGED